MSHDCDDLITIFNTLFQASENTILIKGGAEPLYSPANADFPHNQVIFTQDYFSSALHEIAHWCVAGKERRQQIDYGYWYCPHGRNAAAQKIFEQMEVKPQALEWIFSAAAGVKFHVSADNLALGNQINTQFADKIKQQALHYLATGLPHRAAQFKNSLLKFYSREETFNALSFKQPY